MISVFISGKLEKKSKKKQASGAWPPKNLPIFSFSYAFFSFLRSFSCDSSEILVYARSILPILLS